MKALSFAFLSSMFSNPVIGNTAAESEPSLTVLDEKDLSYAAGGTGAVNLL